MKCPSCGFPDSKVIDSRPVADGSSIRRRRECLECQKRFTTFEMVESVQIVVVKKKQNEKIEAEIRAKSQEDEYFSY